MMNNVELTLTARSVSRSRIISDMISWCSAERGIHECAGMQRPRRWATSASELSSEYCLKSPFDTWP
jgi:hypothetical protein